MKLPPPGYAPVDNLEVLKNMLSF